MIVYNEFEYTLLPGFDKLTEEQQKQVRSEYERGYMSGSHLGIKIATGRGYETAKLAIENLQKAKPVAIEQPVPPSIFAGLID